jgi:regulator of replication initiation timing
MSCIIQNNRTCNLLDCSDTPLSISGNVISILTFFVAALATYFAFFRDVKDIPQSAEEYSNDIRSLHDQLWTIGDIHGQLAKLIASNDSVRISDVQLQSRLQQGQSGSLKEARKLLDDYSASHQDVFTNYFKRHRWIVRVKWILLQNKVAHFKNEASELRSSLTLDLLAITLK